MSERDRPLTDDEQKAVEQIHLAVERAVWTEQERARACAHRDRLIRDHYPTLGGLGPTRISREVAGLVSESLVRAVWRPLKGGR